MKKPTKAEVITALKESIKHWKQMIHWAATVPHPCDMADEHVMLDAVGANWFSRHCSLCTLCHTRGERECIGCPLHENVDCCIEWQDVSWSYSWESWLKNARIMLQRLIRELHKLEQKDIPCEKTNKS